MKRFFNVVTGAIVVLFTLSMVSCEDDISNVGSGLLDTGSTANVEYVDLIAYNTNSDSIRSDAKVLQSAILGVYEEPVFGRTKARFISQARVFSSNLNPNFGANPAMDSVLLTIPVFVKSGESDVVIDTTKIFTAPEDSSDPDTLRIKRTYTLDSIYGKTELAMTLQVREVGEYLLSQDTMYFSNPALRTRDQIEILPNVLGTAQVTNKVTTVETKAENSTSNVIPTPVITIKLDKDYFKQKFIDNGGSNLNDQASFIRNLFRGIELSVAEEQGFLFNFKPNDMVLTMHYSFDNPVENDGDENYEARKTDILQLSFANRWSTAQNSFNVQISQFEHTNRSNQFVNAYTNPNTTSGDSRLYLNGLDGTKTVIKFDQNKLNQIRQNVLEEDWAIVGAELILHIDDSYSLKKPPYLFGWNQYWKDGKIQNINFGDLDPNKYINSYPVNVQFNPIYNYKDDSKKYVIRITDYVKSIVERDELYEDGSMILSLGNFLLNSSSGGLMSQTDPFANNRAFNPHRVVLHGSATEQQDKKLQLKVYYTKK